MSLLKGRSLFKRCLVLFFKQVSALNQCISQNLAGHRQFGAHPRIPTAVPGMTTTLCHCAALLHWPKITSDYPVKHFTIYTNCGKRSFEAFTTPPTGCWEKSNNQPAFGTKVWGSEELRGRQVAPKLVVLYEPWQWSCNDHQLSS